MTKKKTPGWTLVAPEADEDNITVLRYRVPCLQCGCRYIRVRIIPIAISEVGEGVWCDMCGHTGYIHDPGGTEDVMITWHLPLKCMIGHSQLLKELKEEK